MSEDALQSMLERKLRSRSAHVAVIGLGYVGLPTAAILAKAGFMVTGVDVDGEILELLSQGKSHVREPGLDELVRGIVKEGRLKTEKDVTQASRNADVIVVCVQTPLTIDKRPDLTFLENACRQVAKGLSRGKLVIIESTVPPGTTKRIVAPMLEASTGLKCGSHFWLAHCPERAMPGTVLRELVESTKIVGGYEKKSTNVAVDFLKNAIQGEVLSTDCETAEVAKLAENTFRDVNIALANELSLICEEIGVNVTEVVRLANTHPRVTIHRPGIGVGGTCLTKDPYLLIHSAKKQSAQSVILAARRMNDYMPERTTNLITEALKRIGKDVEKAKVAVLGVTYKGDVGSTKNSPVEQIIRELQARNAKVVVYDPYTDENLGAEKAGDIQDAVRDADCIFIAADHEVFRKLDFREIRSLASKRSVVVDGRYTQEREAISEQM